MNVAIIGGGVTGLTAGYELTKASNQVTIFEKESFLGGLAAGFREKGWNWSLERAYHHFFTNDTAITGLIDELGLHDKIITKRPITATLMPEMKGKNYFFWQPDPEIFQLDSPKNLFTFPYLSPIDKARTATLLAFLKLNPFWRPLEHVTAENFFKTIGGTKAWKILWEPLMKGKFSNLSDMVAASWLWARIKKRTPNLCYIDGGFQTLVDALVKAIKKNHGKILLNTSVASIPLDKFDKFLLTVPTPVAAKLIRFPTSYIQPLLSIPHLHAQTLILETKEPILNDVYWLNVNDRSYPFLAAVAHTNFMDKRHYNGHHLTYFGNYLPSGHPYLSMTKQQLLKLFLPYIKRLCPSFYKLSPITYELFSAPFAQPVHALHYSLRAPTIQTPVTNVYLANLDSIYPWDRGTNYAVELGQNAAKKILSSKGS